MPSGSAGSSPCPPRESRSTTAVSASLNIPTCCSRVAFISYQSLQRLITKKDLAYDRKTGLTRTFFEQNRILLSKLKLKRSGFYKRYHLNIQNEQKNFKITDLLIGLKIIPKQSVYCTRTTDFFTINFVIQ